MAISSLADYNHLRYHAGIFVIHLQKVTNAEPEEEEEDDDDEGDGDLSKYNLDDEVLFKEKKEAQPNRATSLCKMKTDVNI